MSIVKNSLTLHNIIDMVKNEHREIWYVSRSGTVKLFNILSELALPSPSGKHRPSGR